MGLDTSPYHGLGKLEELHRRLNRWGSKASNYCLVLFAADHEISRQRFSNYEPMSSYHIVEQHMLGIAPTTRMLNRLGKREYIIDVGLAQGISPDVSIQLTGKGSVGRYSLFSSGNSEFWSDGAAKYSREFMESDSLDNSEVINAIGTGRDFWHILSCNDFGIIGVGEIGIGNTLCSAGLAAVALGLEPAVLVGRGSSSNEVINRKIAIINLALKNRRPQPDNIVDIIARFGGLEIAALVGFISAAADAGVPVMLDGYVTAVAGYLAAMLNKLVPEALVAPSLADQTGHNLILDRLGLQPIFDLNMNYGEGLAAVLGLFLAECTEIFYT